jgi:hypothetical protein
VVGTPTKKRSKAMRRRIYSFAHTRMSPNGTELGHDAEDEAESVVRGQVVARGGKGSDANAFGVGTLAKAFGAAAPVVRP